MRRMQAAGIETFGGQVRLLELAAPASPAPDEVVIRVHAAGVGNWDEFVRVGDWEERSSTWTSFWRGAYEEDPSLRYEFFRAVRRG
jgi:D-arabinose 1-dehydrogenase-like Zn-dependent alcohol dehydrogenase